MSKNDVSELMMPSDLDTGKSGSGARLVDYRARRMSSVGFGSSSDVTGDDDGLSSHQKSGARSLEPVQTMLALRDSLRRRYADRMAERARRGARFCLLAFGRACDLLRRSSFRAQVRACRPASRCRQVADGSRESRCT